MPGAGVGSPSAERWMNCGAAIAAEASITPRPMNSRRVYALALCRSMSGFLIGRMANRRIAHQSVSARCRRIVSTCRVALLSLALFGQHNWYSGIAVMSRSSPVAISGVTRLSCSAMNASSDLRALGGVRPSANRIR